MRSLVVAISVFTISACSSVRPITVEPEQLGTYWLDDVMPPLEMVTFHGPVTACVVVDFTVAKSGKPRKLSTVKASQTEGPFVEAALAHVRSLRFKPAPGNLSRTPARTRKVVSWEWEGWAKDNEAVLAKCAL